MKTTSYNPSQLEVEFAHALKEIKSELEKQLSSNKITGVVNRIQEDNPMVIFELEDKDGDVHEVVFKIIQKPDKF